MYSVKIRSGLRVRFLTFETYSAAIGFIELLTAAKLDPVVNYYFAAGLLSKEARGERINEQAIENDILLDFLHLTVDF